MRIISYPVASADIKPGDIYCLDIPERQLVKEPPGLRCYIATNFKHDIDENEIVYKIEVLFDDNQTIQERQQRKATKLNPFLPPGTKR